MLSGKRGALCRTSKISTKIRGKTPHRNCKRSIPEVSSVLTLAATLSDVGWCTASLTSPKVPSPIVLLSTNCPTCRSLWFTWLPRFEASAPPPFVLLRRLAIALSTEPLRRVAGWGGASTILQQCFSLKRYRPPSKQEGVHFHHGCIRYARQCMHAFERKDAYTFRARICRL